MDLEIQELRQQQIEKLKQKGAGKSVRKGKKVRNLSILPPRKKRKKQKEIQILEEIEE
jgi:uncharacterized Zn ribbon protein